MLAADHLYSRLESTRIRSMTISEGQDLVRDGGSHSTTDGSEVPGYRSVVVA